jgi:hypothetical protein
MGKKDITSKDTTAPRRAVKSTPKGKTNGSNPVAEALTESIGSAAPSKRRPRQVALTSLPVAEPPAPRRRATAQKKLGAPRVAASSFTASDVALRAYFLSEKRRMNGLPGDEHQDWIEAERQLREENAPQS